MKTTDYDRIESAVRYQDSHRKRQPELGELAAHIGLSPSHLHRLFSRWAGVTPKRFLESLTVQHAKKLLDNSESVLSAAYGSGLSGPGRLHDHFVTVEAVTPGEYRSGGAGLTIGHGTAESPFGPVFVAWTDRGICRIGFVNAEKAEAEREALRRTWRNATLMADQPGARSLARDVFAAPFDPDVGPLTVHVRGTNFQLAVWRALLRIPPGGVTTYGRLAEEVCSARAARATGNAVGSNPIVFLIPCHRVIRATGVTGNFGAGPTRKRCMLGWEASRWAGETPVSRPFPGRNRGRRKPPPAGSAPSTGKGYLGLP